MSTSALSYQEKSEDQITVTISEREHRLLRHLQPLFNDKDFMQKLETLLQLFRMEDIYEKEQKKRHKEQLLDQLYGAWADDEDILSVKEIYETRTVSDRAINFD
ncbi:MAG: hypothetical protein AAF849_24645 [Bacteroidota bacterium]